MTKTGRLIRTMTIGSVLAWIAALSAMGATHAARLTRTFGRGQISQAAGIAVDPVTKSVYVADWKKQCVWIFGRDGRYVRKFGGFGRGPGRFLSPSAVAVDAKGQVYVTDTGSYEKKIPGRDSEYVAGPHRIERFDRRGRFLGQRVFAPYTLVRGISASRGGGVLAVMAYDGNASLARFDSRTRALPAPRVRWSSEDAKAVGNAQGYWLTALWDMKHDRFAPTRTPSGSITEMQIVHVAQNGKIVKHMGVRAEGSIAAIAADAGGRVYVAERVREVNEVGPMVERHGRHQVLVYDRRLRRMTSFATNAPAGLAVDAAGNVYVASDRGVQVFQAIRH